MFSPPQVLLNPLSPPTCKLHLNKQKLIQQLPTNKETSPELVISVRTDSISPTALGWDTSLIRQPILLLGRSPAKPTSCKNKYSSANILIS